MTLAALRAFIDAAPAALVEVAQAKGSTPREKGAWMLVSLKATLGTIGGGQLEYMAIDKAREMLGEKEVPLTCLPASSPRKDGERRDGRNVTAPLSPSLRGERGGEGQHSSPHRTLTLSIPLGPEIGQCCGGRVEISIRPVDAALAAELVAAAEAGQAARPNILVFGGGHVGHALASAFALLPVQVTMVDTRPEALEDMPAAVATRLTPVPEEMVREAPAGTAYVVLTHDHALDFLIVAEALKRKDAAYVGMIGSKTKKATFRSWYIRTAGGTEAAFARLVSPIGGNAVRDKRPPVIAAMAAAEIMTALARAAEARVLAEAGR